MNFVNVLGEHSGKEGGSVFPKRRPLNSMELGYAAEMYVIQKLMAYGYTILTPMGGGHRYDLVLEDADGNFWRVQCKMARKARRSDAFEFNAFSVNRLGVARTYTEKEVDYFAVFYKPTNGVYLIPLADCGNKRGYFRLGPPSRANQQGWNKGKEGKYAADYEI